MELAAPPPDADAALLATLGYKQEFKRDFSRFEVFGIAFSIMGVLPSIATTLIYAIPSGGPIAMVWGWLVTCCFIALSGLALGDLASSMPTSGGLYFWTYQMSPKRSRLLLCWLVGYANTLSTTSAVASIDWGCAQMVLAAVSITTNASFQPQNWHYYLVYAAILLTHATLTSFGTRLLARMQTLSTVLCGGLAIAVIIALCAATPSEYKNDAKYALGGWYNETGWNNGAAFMLSMLMAAWTVASVSLAIISSTGGLLIYWCIPPPTSVRLLCAHLRGSFQCRRCCATRYLCFDCPLCISRSRHINCHHFQHGTESRCNHQ